MASILSADEEAMLKMLGTALSARGITITSVVVEKSGEYEIIHDCPENTHAEGGIHLAHAYVVASTALADATQDEIVALAVRADNTDAADEPQARA